MTNDNIIIRECETRDELHACVSLQREVFALPEIEISPVRHFIVTKNAGGFTLGAYAGEELIGFVLSVSAVLRGERALYSHMTAVRKGYQGSGIGARLKWAQRARALSENIKYVKWTFQPVLARNAFFNLEKLGAEIREYEANFYGTDYSTAHNEGGSLGIDSDRLFAEWDLSGPKAAALADGTSFVEEREPAREIEIPNNWDGLVAADVKQAIAEQDRVKAEFREAFSEGLVCRGFRRDDNRPAYLLYED
jgi:predicted GNAT superfamily acetyltransferase